MRHVIVCAALSLLSCQESSPTAPTGGASPPTGPTFSSVGAELSYALDLPPGPGPFPALVIGHGSGRATKDRAIGVAAQLTAAGFAALRYDKRGVGQSSGVYSDVGPGNSPVVIPQLASDMIAGVEFLKTRPEIDPDRIGLFGNSQAGWIIPSAAARSADVQFFVILVGPTVSVGLEIFYSNFAEDTSRSFEELSQILETFSGQHGYDPVPDLRLVNVPGLWVLGGQDRSIPTRETVAILDDLVATQGKPFTVVVHPGGTHGLRDAATGAAIDFWSEIHTWLTPWR